MFKEIWSEEDGDEIEQSAGRDDVKKNGEKVDWFLLGNDEDDFKNEENTSNTDEGDHEDWEDSRSAVEVKSGGKTIESVTWAEQTEIIEESVLPKNVRKEEK